MLVEYGSSKFSLPRLYLILDCAGLLSVDKRHCILKNPTKNEFSPSNNTRCSYNTGCSWKMSHITSRNRNESLRLQLTLRTTLLRRRMLVSERVCETKRVLSSFPVLSHHPLTSSVCRPWSAGRCLCSRTCCPATSRSSTRSTSTSWT